MRKANGAGGVGVKGGQTRTRSLLQLNSARLTQTGRGRRRTTTKEAEADDNDDADGGEVVDDFFTVVGVWVRAGSRSRATQTETIQVRFHNWERARRPDLLLARCIARLMARVLDGRAEPLRVGLSVQPPGWDNCFHVPMRPPQQNSAHALAAALEAFAKQYDELDLFSADVCFKVSAVWALPAARVEGACAEDEQRARGTVRCQSFVPVVNGAGGDRWCMARAIVLGLAQRRICVLEQRNVVHFRAFCLAQRGEAGAPEARRLLEDAAVPLDRPTYGATEAQRVQRWLDASLGPHQVRLVIFARELAYRIAWKGARPARFNLCLVAQDGHFGYIQCPEQLFHLWEGLGRASTVWTANSRWTGARTRKAAGRCAPQCLRFGWGRPCAREPGHAPSRCADCLFVFENADCFEAHRRRVDPPPPGWQHDRRRGRPQRPMCEERRVCTRWSSGGLDPSWGARVRPQQQHQRPPASSTTAVRALLRHSRRAVDPPLHPAEAGAVSADRQRTRSGHPSRPKASRTTTTTMTTTMMMTTTMVLRNRIDGGRPLRFLFWDVECAQVADEDEEEGDEEVPARVLKHVPLLVCAEVICERCVAAGVDLEREPDRRAPGCCCGGAAWRDGQTPPVADARARGRVQRRRRRERRRAGDDGGGQTRAACVSSTTAATGRTPMAQFADFVLHDGPVNKRAYRSRKHPSALCRGTVRCASADGGAAAARSAPPAAGRHRAARLHAGAGRTKSAQRGRQGLAELFRAVPCPSCRPCSGWTACRTSRSSPTTTSGPKTWMVAHVGLPPAADYDPDRMRPAERDAFQRWYAAEQQRRPHRLFVLRRELLRYCANDVRILRRACLRFRQVVGELSGGVEPFLAATTIAGLALAIYRQRHLPRDLMVHTPEGASCAGDAASAASRHFFALLERLRPQWRGRLRTARWSIGEACVEDDATGWTRCCCPECYPRRHQVLAGGQTAESLCARTRQRAWELEQQHGFTVRAVWECAFQRWLRRQPTRVRRLYTEVCRAVPGPMDLRRDALFGGRVEPFALHYTCTEREEIDALDIVSLYPFVMKYRAFPVGLPRVLSAEQLDRDAAVRLPWTSAEQNPFRGFLHCRVLPPRPAELGDRHALLPYRTRTGRLTFPLCAACAEWANVDKKVQRHHRTVPRCRHRAAQRAWTHAYTDVELNAALQLGYRVLALYEVWHYDRWASKEAGNSLFAGYVDTMLRLKVEASGWPADCQTVEQRARATLRATRTGRASDSRRAPRAAEPGAARGRQGIAELPMGAREFHELLGDPRQDVVDFVHLNEQLDRCVVRRRWPFVRAPDTNNLAVACFVTAHARLHLHGRLEEVRLAGGRMLYCDTDSVYFVRARRPPGPQQQQQFLRSEGDAFGQLMREWPGRRIVQFFSAAPKNYGFRHRCAASGGDERAERKVRGLELTYTASQLLPFERIASAGAQLLFGRMPDAEQRVAVPCTRFVRTKRAEVFTRRGTKLYQPVYTKGLVVALDDREAGGGAGNAYFTRPFGWYDDEEADRDDADEEEEAEDGELSDESDTDDDDDDIDFLVHV
ncbi:hypothetical protein niasHT_033771 [Heterodera trifolii]|uniref:DNA-directed DNA polymerase n=1 Tax=Heterodera trifolii TaxID=157864 RepID=A0ABD2IXK6_9BILA